MFSKNSNKHGKRVIACYEKKNNTACIVPYVNMYTYPLERNTTKRWQ